MSNITIDIICILLLLPILIDTVCNLFSKEAKKTLVVAAVAPVSDGKIEMSKPYNLQAVVICVGYADFLAYTLPTNRSLFNKMVVVTTKADKATQRLCEYYHIQCIQSEVCYENGAKFNKGKMINVGLAELDPDAWHVHIDADIILPPKFRMIIDNLKLDTEVIYGADRLLCNSSEAWLDFLKSPVILNEADIYVHLKHFPVGTRISKEAYGGWVPIGFFQMWYGPAKYPVDQGDAGHSDILFALGWPREKRQLLPEIITIHLATGQDMGTNWNGRVTPQFMSIPHMDIKNGDYERMKLGDKTNKGTVVGLVDAKVFVGNSTKDFSNWDKKYPDWKTSSIVYLEDDVGRVTMKPIAAVKLDTFTYECEDK